MGENSLNETLEEIKKELKAWLEKTEKTTKRIKNEKSKKPVILTRSRNSLKAFRYALPIISRLF